MLINNSVTLNNDTEKRQYLSSRVKSLFSLKCDFMTHQVVKKETPH